MGRKKERPSTRPVDWEKLTKASTSKKDDRPALLAPGYAGTNPSEFPSIGGKEDLHGENRLDAERHGEGQLEGQLSAAREGKFRLSILEWTGTL